MTFFNRWLGRGPKKQDLEKEVANARRFVQHALIRIQDLQDRLLESDMNRLSLLNDLHKMSLAMKAFSDKEPEQDPFKVLGVSRYCSMDEAHKAWRSELSKWHPDKVSHLDDSLSHIKDLVERKYHEVNRAYQQLTGG
jgi:DnaJ-domain-containing protein 1